MKLFDSAAFRLTAWYLLVIMLISVTFSAIIYSVSSNELRRQFQFGAAGRGLILDVQAFEDLQRERFERANTRLVGNLITLNLSTLALGGAAAYFLARRTLRPISEAMDKQARFTGDASHELRTPLAAMRTELEVALRDARLKLADARSLLASNLEEVVALQGLSDRLLQLSSDEPLELRPADIGTVATTAIARVALLAAEKSVTIETEAAGVRVLADTERLADLLAVLLDNAVKYSQSGGVVMLRAEVNGRSAVISVTDQGVGISESDITHIFDRFYRGDGARGRSGHGLGLSIAQRIAEQHQTRITVTSLPGKGSTFSVKLQLAQTE